MDRERVYDSHFGIYHYPVSVAENIEKIQRQISVACQRAGRAPDSVTLLAVAKTQPPEAVQAAADLGLTLFGENKVQEAKAKIPLCPGNLRWHFIGHLQSNKCRDAVELFEMIQSVDSLSLAQELNKRAEQASKTMPILLEVNVAGEGSKFGYAPEQLVAEIEELNRLRRLEIDGLMCVPPWSPEPEHSRAHFQRLRQLKEQCEHILEAPLTQLSMGMSGDFEVAIEEGATLVRIGTALFGPRLATKRTPAG